MMRGVISTTVFCGGLMFLTACDPITEDYAESIGITPAGNEMAWTGEKTLLFVQGKNYEVQIDTGRDLKTGEVLVRTYSTYIDGEKLDCGPGGLENCRKQIEAKLGPREPIPLEPTDPGH